MSEGNWLLKAGALEVLKGSVELGSQPPAPYQDMMAALSKQYPEKKLQVFKHGSRHWIKRLA